MSTHKTKIATYPIVVKQSKAPDVQTHNNNAAASTVKCSFFGDSGVGKSSLLLRYATGEYTGNFISTIGVDFKTVSVERDNDLFKLQLWDHTGYPTYEQQVNRIKHDHDRRLFFHTVIVVFDFTDSISFNNVKNNIEKMKREIGPNVCIILVGNKADALDKRVVESREAIELVESNPDIYAYVETSAKENKNVALIFDYIIDWQLQTFKKKSKDIPAEKPHQVANEPKKKKWYHFW